MEQKELLALLNKYEEAYYSGESLVSDEEYDALKEKYISLYGEYNFVPSEGNTGFKKVEHIHPLLSLDKIQLNELHKIPKILGPNITKVQTPKREISRPYPSSPRFHID